MRYFNQNDEITIKMNAKSGIVELFEKRSGQSYWLGASHIDILIDMLGELKVLKKYGVIGEGSNTDLSEI